MKHLLMGAAVIVFAANPLSAQGNGHGKGQSGGHGNAASGPSMHGPSIKGQTHQAPSHGNAGQVSGSKTSAMESGAPQHGRANGKSAAPANSKGSENAARDGNAGTTHPVKMGPQGAPHGNGHDKARVERTADGPKPGIKVLEDGRRYYSAPNSREGLDFVAARRGLIDGCPPGLAKKNNGCQPPGLAKQRVYQPDWWGLRGIASGPYAYSNGYLLRLNGDRVAGYVPLLGGALSVGNIWPSMYAPLPVPRYYADYYDLGPVGSYRYADNVLYRVDPSTAAITSIAALLTGDNFQIGSPIPSGYGVYNVPYPYRSQYVDGPNASYRYSDGYVYQVDPSTQLVTAAIELLAR